jgi:uncharacterized protein (TIGR03435 family)
MKGVALIAAALVVQATASPQPTPTFEVVSIRPSTSADTGWRVGAQPGGRWVLVNAAILALVRAAYPTDSSEYVGGPDWLRTERYDVTALGPAGTTQADMEPMLRALLAERFRFKGHYETVERPVYNMVLARSDGEMPPGLGKVDLDCEARRDANVRGEKPLELPRRPNGQLPCAYGMRYAESAQISAGGITMATLARTIQAAAGRVIADKTGLDGYYEFTLSFTEQPTPNSNHTDIFTALQEQLGLRLTPALGSVRIFVVDHVERPTEN